jgi:hypothetical protein
MNNIKLRYISNILKFQNSLKNSLLCLRWDQFILQSVILVSLILNVTEKLTTPAVDIVFHFGDLKFRKS